MRSTISFNGWVFIGQTRLAPGLYSDRYQSQCGWKAETIFKGRKNESIGLSVWDKDGKFVGMVPNVQELP